MKLSLYNGSRLTINKLLKDSIGAELDEVIEAAQAAQAGKSIRIA